MKRIFVILMILLCGASSKAQQWENNLENGLKAAARQNKKVLLFFSVPEQCDACVRLEKTVFSSPEFNAFAEQHLVLVKVDFSYRQEGVSKEQMEKNLLIVEKYNKDGFFPHVVVLNKDAKISAKIGVYNRETPQHYLSLIASAVKS